ncbi:DNA/RNA non-specific endonuclease [Amedibacillus dolichus]|uniref:DNA/RNA non-specific endonuclease n=1 Tax=Amedibacillus dolichus TaxID=31971 RepID=A0ABT7UC37_9FIRM|nr:DNA/RNA non-specific endonuclease [Amedibacillus dolichus]MDM8157201.1 DNA/RNA non-specific endonuclease [Amedibacillus dolichus]
MKRRILCTSLIAVLLASLFGCASLSQERPQEDAVTITIDEVPVYSGDPYVVINDNEPSFSSEELESDSFESYGELDDLGRCTIAFANLSSELMPQAERGSIGQVKPSGWQTVRYDSVDGKYLYNRCHLIGWQLSGENANERNLITGTRYMNTEGMLPFENMVADHIKETDGHVLYRVTPIFVEDELVARGVQMEAYSIEDAGASICFNVFVYNVQPGIEIDYSDGSSRLSETADESQEDGVIRGNSRSKIYHCPGQAAYEDMADSRYLVLFDSEEEAIAAGYRKAQR